MRIVHSTSDGESPDPPSNWASLTNSKTLVPDGGLETWGLGLLIALRPQTSKHIRGGWSQYTDTSKPVDGVHALRSCTCCMEIFLRFTSSIINQSINQWWWGSKYGHCPIRVSNQGHFDLWPNALTTALTGPTTKPEPYAEVKPKYARDCMITPH
jgi:hypothetical protein